jgi:hypothetical protein
MLSGLHVIHDELSVLQLGGRLIVKSHLPLGQIGQNAQLPPRETMLRKLLRCRDLDVAGRGLVAVRNAV